MVHLSYFVYSVCTYLMNFLYLTLVELKAIILFSLSVSPTMAISHPHYGNQSPPQLRYSSKRPQYRPLTSVGIARCTVPEGIQFPHTCCHFVGHWNSSNIHVDLLLAPYQQYWQPDCLVARICCKASSNVCHALAISDAAHGSIQQPAHNPVAVQACRIQNHFLPYMNVMPYHDIILVVVSRRDLFTCCSAALSMSYSLPSPTHTSKSCAHIFSSHIMC